MHTGVCTRYETGQTKNDDKNVLQQRRRAHIRPMNDQV